jgi:hypothetical protein
MLKTWLRHYIYEISIGVLFGELIKNFRTPPLAFLYLTQIFNELKSDGIIDGFTFHIDSDTGDCSIDIDAPQHVKDAIAEKMYEITNK